MGGMRGTTSRLKHWLSSLAGIINAGAAPPAVVGLVLAFFQVPDEAAPFSEEAGRYTKGDQLSTEPIMALELNIPGEPPVIACGGPGEASVGIAEGVQCHQRALAQPPVQLVQCPAASEPFAPCDAGGTNSLRMAGRGCASPR